MQATSAKFDVLIVCFWDAFCYRRLNDKTATCVWYFCIIVDLYIVSRHCDAQYQAAAAAAAAVVVPLPRAHSLTSNGIECLIGEINLERKIWKTWPDGVGACVFYAVLSSSGIRVDNSYVAHHDFAIRFRQQRLCVRSYVPALCPLWRACGFSLGQSVWLISHKIYLALMRNNQQTHTMFALGLMLLLQLHVQFNLHHACQHQLIHSSFKCDSFSSSFYLCWRHCCRCIVLFHVVGVSVALSSADGWRRVHSPGFESWVLTFTACCCWQLVRQSYFTHRGWEHAVRAKQPRWRLHTKRWRLPNTTERKLARRLLPLCQVSNWPNESSHCDFSLSVKWLRACLFDIYR